MDLSALSNLTTTAQGLSNLILVSPQKITGYQPQNPPNADGTPSTDQPPQAFLFDYEGENQVTLESDISDHFIEDNTAIQDQIALRPIMINTEGYIGEVNNVVPPALSILKAAADKLTVISAYAPSLSVSAQIAYNTAFQLYQTAQNTKNAAVATWSSLQKTGGTSVINGNTITKQPNQTKQQTAFQQFYGYWQSRTLFTVQTPWAIFQNCAIKSITAVQDAETKYVTTFKCVFKPMRFSNATLAVPAVLAGRLSSQASPSVDLGTSTPQPSIPVSTGLANMGAP